jgi:phage tail-like protein
MDLVTLDGATVESYVLLSHRAQWRALSLDAVEESPCDGDLRLLALPGNGRPLVDSGGTFGGLDEPTGVAVDRWGTIYMSDAAACVVLRFDPCCGRFEPLPCLGGAGSAPRRLRSPHGLAVSPQGVLHVADTDNRRVQLFSVKETALLSIWGPIDADGDRVAPTWTPPPGGADCEAQETMPGAWRPWDIALDSRGRAYVSDRENRVVHAFDRHGRWLEALDGHGPGLPGFTDPTALAVDLDDRLYVAQGGVDYVVVVAPDGTVSRAEPPQALAGRFRPAAIATDPNGDLFIADSVTRRLHCYRCGGPPGTPVHFTGGACTIEGPTQGLAFDPQGNPLVLANGGQIIHLEGGAAFALEGSLVTTALDSGLDGCEWHRVVLSGRVDGGDAVRVHTYTSDVERADDEILGLPPEAWATALTWSSADSLDVWDCLVLSPPGRYLWLRLVLTGSGTTTPTISSAKVELPRDSSIQYLPAVFRSTPPESTFLERFLSIFDTLFGTIEGRLDRMPEYLDADSAPAQPLGRGSQTDWLSWLASWLGLDFEGRWNVPRRRNMLRHIARLYRWRGTPRGLREAVLVLLGLDPDICAALPFPGILEGFKLRRWLFVGNAELGDTSTLWGKRIVDRLELGENSTIGSFQITGVNDPLRDPFWVYAHQFTVFIPASMAPTEDDRLTIERILEASKPAHTKCVLELVEPRFRVGIQASIGLDTAIGRYPSSAREGEATVGYDAVLQDDPTRPARPEFRVGTRAQIGSTVL